MINMSNPRIQPGCKESPWQTYKDVKSSHIFTHKEILDLILNSGRTLELKALISLFYLTGARRSEILSYRSRDIDLKGKEIRFPGIALKDIQPFKVPYKDKILDACRIYTIVLKSYRPSYELKQLKLENFEKYVEKKRSQLVQVKKKQAIIFLAGEDGPLLRIIDEYIDSEKRFFNKFGEMDMNEPLFKKNSSYYQKEIYKIMHCTCHNLRVSRFRVLLNERDYTISDIQLTGGWSNILIPSRYLESISAQVQQRELTHLIANRDVDNIAPSGF